MVITDKQYNKNTYDNSVNEKIYTYFSTSI